VRRTLRTTVFKFRQVLQVTKSLFGFTEAVRKRQPLANLFMVRKRLLRLQAPLCPKLTEYPRLPSKQIHLLRNPAAPFLLPRWLRDRARHDSCRPSLLHVVLYGKMRFIVRAESANASRDVATA
jgi:hypothetical protein